MLWPVVWIVSFTVFTAFAFVIAFGAPFLPTLSPQVPRALDLMNLKPGDTLLELGSGDGRILIAAAERGMYAIGYELNPLLAIFSWLRTRKYGGKVKVVWGNFWHKQLPPAEGIFVFLLNPYMKRLDQKILRESKKPVKLISFAFQIPNRKPTKTKYGLHLYQY
jgi:16S rRNA A1518/A1519 N6-dimethyltransferase RsmA/KsgA/DIM1 with predicted DNA glycosylase/AP lyase activity